MPSPKLSSPKEVKTLHHIAFLSAQKEYLELHGSFILLKYDSCVYSFIFSIINIHYLCTEYFTTCIYQLFDERELPLKFLLEFLTLLIFALSLS